MKRTGVSAYQLLIAASAVALFSVFLILPVKASALEVNTQTQQILPLGGNTCSPIEVTNFTPYVYNNNLSSLEFTVSDPAYVAVVGSVGNTSIPLRYMTRSMDVSGGVRYHIDVDNTPLTGTVPVTVTLLSARTGSPVCASVISVNLGSGEVVSTPIYTGNPTTVTPAPVTTAPNVTAPTATTSGEGNMTTATSSGAPVVSSGMENPLKGLCTSEASAYRLWLILLIIYALVVGGLLWLEFPVSWNWAKTPERVATIMLVLLVLLLGFWYVSSACRAALWMPLLAFLIAILGLLAAFWNHPRVTQLLLIEQKASPVITPLPPAKPVIITPPPAVVKSTTTTTTTTSTTAKNK